MSSFILKVFLCNLLLLGTWEYGIDKVSTKIQTRLHISRTFRVHANPVERSSKLLHHIVMVAKFLDLNNPWSCKYGSKNKKNWHVQYDFLMHDCTWEQNSSPYFSSIVQQCKQPSLSRRIVEILKFCYHGNVSFTSCYKSGHRTLKQIISQYLISAIDGKNVMSCT